ncbi:helix-turn-helix domain-containing protein [Streptomyces sp. NPDC048718]|uniref:helix-turn-helix domain-containing protein n=1 Tax=Streptomyces sp. NPDC048718 TaxID=3365587 RepID=UPI003714EE12
MSTADGFAGRMRELKERSGLSYGVLAKRLHVSTSTLHRYCNGDAVPTGFAPVERLGRLCGASRDELVELHRAWIVADEARRTNQPVAAATVPERERERDGDRAPRRDRDEREARGEAAGAVAGAEVVVVAEPAGVPVAPEPAAPEVAVPPVPEAAPASCEAGGRRLRWRAVLGATAAVIAVALAVPLVRTPASPDPDLGAAGDDAPAGPPAPLSAGISSYNWAEPCGQYYLLDQDPEHVPPPPAPQDTRGWARALDGVDGGHMQLQITVTGGTQEAVVLSALHVRVMERGEPLDRTAYSMGDGCGGALTPQTFDIDLDAPRPYAKPVAGRDGDRVVPAKNFPYQVATGDPQVLNLDVHTEGHDVTWYLELTWSDGARQGTMRVDDGGKPFRTSAMKGRPTYGYRADNGTWFKQN